MLALEGGWQSFSQKFQLKLEFTCLESNRKYAYSYMSRINRIIPSCVLDKLTNTAFFFSNTERERERVGKRTAY